jgi:hypothetical protein
MHPILRVLRFSWVVESHRNPVEAVRDVNGLLERCAENFMRSSKDLGGPDL